MRRTIVTFAALIVAAALTTRADVIVPPCPDCLRAAYWLVADDDWTRTGTPQFPESARLQAQRPDDFGVAFSGGGTRSAAAELGQLRGLRQNGWLARVRYISAVSGGAWAAVPFTYTKETPDTFLGRFDAPGALDRATLIKTPNGPLAKAIVDSSLAAGSVQEAAAFAAKTYTDKAFVDVSRQVLTLFGKARREPDRTNKTYARLLGRLFIDPLVDPSGSKSSGRLFAWDYDTVNAMAGANPGKLPADIIVAGHDRPFLIVGGTLVSSRADYPFPLLMPVEYTPLYVGVRHHFGDWYGGTYVWPWAYDTLQVGAQADGLIQVQYDPARTFTLADVIASTGAAPELTLLLGDGVPQQIKSLVQSFAGYFPSFTHFTVQADGAVRFTPELPHGDGGFEDNLGLMPLLARQVRNVLVFINTNTHEFGSNDDIQSFFRVVGPPGGSGDKRMNRVFEETHYTELMNGFEALRNDPARPGMVYCGKDWQVLPNEHYNVRGYDGLNICWIYNFTAPAWQAALPADLQLMVSGQDRSKAGKHFDDFPWFSTFEQNAPHVIQLTTPQVNLLSNLTAWTITQDATVARVKAAFSVPLP